MHLRCHINVSQENREHEELDKGQMAWERVNGARDLRWTARGLDSGLTGNLRMTAYGQDKSRVEDHRMASGRQGQECNHSFKDQDRGIKLLWKLITWQHQG